MILATLTLPLGALLLMHALQLLETWALQDTPTSAARLPEPALPAGGHRDLRDG